VSTLVHANKIDEVSRGGALTSIQTRTSERGTGTTSARLPGSSLEAVKFWVDFLNTLVQLLSEQFEPVLTLHGLFVTHSREPERESIRVVGLRNKK
jgi:hypothetical protein